MMSHTKYQGSIPCGFRQEYFFFTFPYISLIEHFTPWGGAIFGIYLTNLVDVYLVMLHTKYQDSMPCGFRQKDFFTFSLYKSM